MERTTTKKQEAANKYRKRQMEEEKKKEQEVNLMPKNIKNGDGYTFVQVEVEKEGTGTLERSDSCDSAYLRNPRPWKLTSNQYKK